MPDDDAPTISSAMEDYLKALLDLGRENVKTQPLADALGVSAASVTGMLKKLSALNLVDHEPYKGATLTEAGAKVALETVRHHRLLETYLAEALGYPWHEVHDEAERLEHYISEAFEARMVEALGDPTHDPHGDPIPRLDGSVPESVGRPLLELEPGAAGRVVRVLLQDSEVLAYLAELGLVPGADVAVRAKAPFDGPVTVVADGSEVALAARLAAGLLVDDGPPDPDPERAAS